MRKWFVSRQCYWGVEKDEQNVVEIAAGGCDYANPDMLVSKYSGEGEEYTDPREAVKSALEIAKQWKTDAPDLKINIAHGFTAGNTLPFEPDTEEQLLAWAEEAYQKQPKCDQCGEILPEKHYYAVDNPDLGKFCREYCAEKALEEVARLNDEIDAEQCP